ncbi:MAG: hypothetical protein ABFC57_12885 [Veillonellales bacterium]
MNDTDQEKILKYLRDEKRNMFEEIRSVKDNPECKDIFQDMVLHISATKDSAEYEQVLTQYYKKLLPYIRK